MLVYFKNRHGEIVEPKQGMEDFGSIKRVIISKLHYCCQYSRNIEEIFLDNIDAHCVKYRNFT